MIQKNSFCLIPGEKNNEILVEVQKLKVLIVAIVFLLIVKP